LKHATLCRCPARFVAIALLVWPQRGTPQGRRLVFYFNNHTNSHRDDLGKPGNDEFYGAGFVNALRAVE
jgi:hypothetical protein